MQRFSLCILLAILFSLGVQAQTPSLGIFHLTALPDSNTFLNGQLFDFYLKNTGTSNFTGVVEFWRNGDSTNYVIHVDTTVNLNPGDSMNIIADDTVMQNRYHGGGNIVVIWPVAPMQTIMVSDSGTVNLYIEPLTSADISDQWTGFEMGPNPAMDFLRIRTDAKVERYEIVTMDGRVLDAGCGTYIETGHLPPGMYFLRVKTSDGVGVRRFVKRSS